jgi:alcohol dehydrogenase class IV
MQYESHYDYRINTFPCRVYSGRNALASLPAEVKRQKGRRAFIICGRSVSRKTPLIDSLRKLLGDVLVGVFDEMGKDTPLEDCERARDAAREAGADLLIAVGGGSVVQGARITAILLAEKGPLESLITQYPEEGPAVSARLLAPKLPIINVLTNPTSAQNRGGSPAKYQGRRIEFFDPKTRPMAQFWDPEALATMPVSQLRTSAAALYWRVALDMGYVKATPLSVINRRGMFTLIRDAIRRLDDGENMSARMDMCVATFLQNREGDDGGARVPNWAGRFGYSLSAAIINLHEEAGQGESRAAITGVTVRMLGPRDPVAMCNIAESLEVWKPGDPVEEAPERAAAALCKEFAGLGMPANLTELGIPKSSAPTLLKNSLTSFNADPKREFKHHQDMLREVLEACW